MRGASRAPASRLICRGCVCRCAGVMRSGVGEEQALSPREVCRQVGGIRCAVCQWGGDGLFEAVVGRD